MTKRVSEKSALQSVTRIVEDPVLSPVEKEFSITMSRSEDRMTVYSAISSTTRSLLGREDFSFDWAILSDDGTECYGVRGTLPVGVLRLTPNGRSHARPSAIVADHDDATNPTLVIDS